MGYQCTWLGLWQRVSRRCTATTSVVMRCFVACCVAWVCRVALLPVLVVFAFLLLVVGLVCHRCFRVQFGGFASSFVLCVLACGALGREVVHHVSCDVQSQASCRAVVAETVRSVMVMLMCTAVWLHPYASVYCGDLWLYLKEVSALSKCALPSGSAVSISL